MFVVENQRSGQETGEPILASLVTLRGACGQARPLTESWFLCVLDEIHIFIMHTLT